MGGRLSGQIEVNTKCDKSENNIIDQKNNELKYIDGNIIDSEIKQNDVPIDNNKRTNNNESELLQIHIDNITKLIMDHIECHKCGHHTKYTIDVNTKFRSLEILYKDKNEKNYNELYKHCAHHDIILNSHNISDSFNLYLELVNDDIKKDLNVKMNIYMKKNLYNKRIYLEMLIGFYNNSNMIKLYKKCENNNCQYDINYVKYDIDWNVIDMYVVMKMKEYKLTDRVICL
jgi:hypothetical protein